MDNAIAGCADAALKSADVAASLNLEGASFGVRRAEAGDLAAVKTLLDAHRHELGFVPMPAVRTACARGWLHVAEIDGLIVGAINWWARRDSVVVLYNIVVSTPVRSLGVGWTLLQTLVVWASAQGAREIRLKCPSELPANAFYARAGFVSAGQEVGKRRPLTCWMLSLET